MLPKKHRISTKDWPRSGLKRFKTESFLFLYRQLPQTNTSQFGVVVSKKVSNKAVTRNKLKRRIYQALKETNLVEQSLIMIVVAQKSVTQLKYSEIVAEFNQLSQKL